MYLKNKNHRTNKRSKKLNPSIVSLQADHKQLRRRGEIIPSICTSYILHVCFKIICYCLPHWRSLGLFVPGKQSSTAVEKQSIATRPDWTRSRCLRGDLFPIRNRRRISYAYTRMSKYIEKCLSSANIIFEIRGWSELVRMCMVFVDVADSTKCKIICFLATQEGWRTLSTLYCAKLCVNMVIV